MTIPLTIKRLNLAHDYLQNLNKEGYKIIDLNMIEPFESEDKKYQPSNIVIDKNQALYAIRSDWTRSLLNYQNRYRLDHKEFGYFGPVLRDFETLYQAGIELYEVDNQRIKDSILFHLEFVKNKSTKNIRTIIVNDEKLIDLYIEKYSLEPSIKQTIFDKDISTLKETLGVAHPLYQAMTTTVSQQFDLVKKEFKEEKSLQFIIDLKEAVLKFEATFILDLSFRSPQGYYNGFYFQSFLNENIPVLSGGVYNHNSFGIGVNLTNGGLL